MPKLTVSPTALIEEYWIIDSRFLSSSEKVRPERKAFSKIRITTCEFTRKKYQRVSRYSDCFEFLQKHDLAFKQTSHGGARPLTSRRITLTTNIGYSLAWNTTYAHDNVHLVGYCSSTNCAGYLQKKKDCVNLLSNVLLDFELEQ